jgi:hypothetical protein
LIALGLEYRLTITILVMSIILLLEAPYHFIANTNVIAQTYPHIASTRNFFDVDTGNTKQIGALRSPLEILGISNCPDELAIYVHGVWAREQQAREQTERVFLSLQHSGYNNIPVIGFSWDSNTAFSLDDISTSQRGWNIAKNIANKNGPILAQFIDNFKQECTEDKLRIIAHSLGTRVVLSAIQSLYVNHNTTIPPSSRTITSVHLLGPAVNDEQVSLVENGCSINSPPLQCSRDAIDSEVIHFYNLYNPQDNMLAYEQWSIPFCLNPFLPATCYTIDIDYPSPYHYTEGGNPLGAYPILGEINVPENYREYNVLPYVSVDDDADKYGGCDLTIDLSSYNPFFPSGTHYCTITKTGDNHFGYMGYRSETNRKEVTDSGAMELVVQQWENENN